MSRSFQKLGNALQKRTIAIFLLSNVDGVSIMQFPERYLSQITGIFNEESLKNRVEDILQIRNFDASG